jgi:hypothetical protein
MFGERTCPILKNIAPKKLLLIPNSHHAKIHFGRLNDEYLEEVVVHVNVHMNAWRPHALDGAPFSKRLVVIVRNFSYTDSPGRVQEGGNRLEGDLDGFGPRGWAGVLAQSLVVCGRRNWNWILREIVVVNHDELNGIRGQQGQPVTFETCCRDRLAAERLRTQSTASNGSSTSTPSEVDYKFISTKEYLKGYDWEGVYTDQEATGLLELIED